MDTTEKYKQSKMCNWYDPFQLSGTAMKAIVSGTFASYADKRELQAALDPKKNYFDNSIDELSETRIKEIWIDFISDTADGFNSTYTVADLVSQNLNVKLDSNYKGEKKPEETNWDLPPGELLLLGGDQVYPTPSMAEYDNKFKIPFMAASKKNHGQDGIERKMFAIPGNHDWYDGLGNFIKLFCQNRTIGNWKTCQHRSYFAIKLPHNYWLWATDVQLNSDIDQPQKDYFMEIATRHMQDGDKVILCTAEPAWVYKAIHHKNASYKRLKYFEQVFITDDRYDYTQGKKFKLVATLTGDLHHYSRYEELKKTSDGNEYINQLITAGGGGAFMHPTHNLPQTLTKLNEQDDKILANSQIQDPELKACFPSKKSSRKLANKILVFPFNNLRFWISMSAIQLLLAWMLQSTNRDDDSAFMQELASIDNLKEFVTKIYDYLFLNPPVFFICLIVIVGMRLFTDTNSGKRNYKWLGFLHGFLQLFCMFLFIWLFSWLNISKLNSMQIFNIDIFNDLIYLVAYILETFLLGGLIGSLIFGLYLWFCNCFLDIHMDESFSSLAHQHYKNFLRIHIRPDGDIAIYPIGIERVVTDWKQEEEGENIKFNSETKAQYYLIEPPIIIKNSQQ